MGWGGDLFYKPEMAVIHICMAAPAPTEQVELTENPLVQRVISVFDKDTLQPST